MGISVVIRSFEKVQSKATRAYAQSGQYHIIVESRVHLTMTTLLFLREITEMKISTSIFHDILF